MAAEKYQWFADDKEIEGADEATLLITEDMVGKIISVTAFAEDGETAIATCTEAVILSDTDAPEILEAEVIDAWTLGVLFDEDVFKGDDYSLTVTLAGEDVEVKETIDGAAMTLVKADGSSFAAGVYTVTITDLEDESGNAADELTATITKDNSYAAGFSAYEGYMAEYDKLNEGAGDIQPRKIHVVVTDQFGETISSALSATYGSVKTKATIKSSGSIIASTFNKTGEEVDGQTMAFVNIGADKECIDGETLVVELTNSIDGTPYVSSFEVAIVGYDLVATADTVTGLTQTTVKDEANKQFVEGIDGGVLTMSDNNEVGLVATVVDFHGDTATKGMVKFVSSDSSVVKVSAGQGGAYRENVIVDAATAGNGYGEEDAAFGVWFKALKPGEATITAYATGNIEDAYTFAVTVEGAELALAGTDSYAGEVNYLPLTGTAGLDDAVITGTVGEIWIEDDAGERYTYAGTQNLTDYLATGSKADQDKGLTKGQRYLVFNATAFNDQYTYVYTASAKATAAGTTLAETEELEIYMRPRVKVDSSKTGSGIFVGTASTVEATAEAITPTKATGIDKIVETATNGMKGTTVYAAINVVNTVPMQIGNYAAKQIKYTWSEDTVGSAKVNISNDGNTLWTNGTALLEITPKTDEVIGKLTLSVGGEDKELTINLGKTPVATGTVEAEWVDDGKAALIAGTGSTATNGFVTPSTAADHKVKLTVKDQYGNKINPTIGGTVGTTALRLANANGTANPFTIADELTVAIATTANPGELEATFSNMAPGEHELTFYIGERTTISKDDPQATITVNFVQKKDLTEIVPQASVKWTADDSGAGSDWDGVIGTFGDAISLTSGAIAAGMFFDTEADSTITPSAKVYAGDVEVTGVDVDWSILDESFSFTETWIEDTTAGTAAGSQTVTSNGGLWATTDGENITLDVDATTDLSVPTDGQGYDVTSGAATDRIATEKGDWGTGTATLDKVLTFAALADSGESATVTATIHLNANIAGTDLDSQSYVNLSTAGMSLDVDDIYLAYGAGSDGVSVTENAAVGDAIKVKAGNATGTIVRVVAVDSVYGAELYDENTTGGRFVLDASTADGLVVGTDAATVIDNGNGASATDGVVNIKADAGTNGKTASLRLPVTVGSKNRFLTVALDIVK